MGNDPGARACVIGGTVLGQIPRELTWGEVKRGSDNRYDGDALQMQSDEWGIVNGFRADNIEDAVVPYGLFHDTMYVRKVYASYVRDDCIENDWPIINMVVEDSLFDGCFIGDLGTTEQDRRPLTPARLHGHLRRRADADPADAARRGGSGERPAGQTRRPADPVRAEKLGVPRRAGPPERPRSHGLPPPTPTPRTSPSSGPAPASTRVRSRRVFA